MRSNPSFLLPFTLFAALVSAAQAQPQPPAQNPSSVRKDPLGVTLSSPTLSTRVEVWADQVIRVIHQPASGHSAPPRSLTVVAKPLPVNWKLSAAPSNAQEVVLSTSLGKVFVDKNTGRVRVTTPEGEVILSEAENGTTLTSTDTGSAKGTLSITQKFALDPKEAIYGLGQHPENGTLNNVGTRVVLKQENTKVAVPVLLSSKGYALLWDNPAITDIDCGRSDKASVAWHSEAGAGVDYYVFLGPKPDQAIAAYRWLTGSAPLFGKWAWGFWQSRERYKTQEEILGVVSEYRKRGIPLDGIIQDWQFWPPLNQQTAAGGWGSHEFDKARYPNPAAMIRDLHAEHAHIMVVSWAKFDVTDKNVSIPNLKELEAVNGAFNPPIPYVFPKGRGKWYDPFNDRAREVYWKLLGKKLFPLGVDAWWLDASEAEFSGKWGEFRDFNTAKGSGALVFNAYPLEHTRAVYEGQRSASPEKRALILTRSAYAGQQRNGSITWSGDIPSKWEVLQKQVPAGLNFCASGVPYWNTDIGGFFGNNPDDPQFVERFVRWFQFGSFCPMFRVHGTDKPKEVWRFDQGTQKTLTDFINLRYHLLPYIYSVSWMVTHDGYTLMRPLVMDFQNDSTALNISDQFMFGPALLACPVLTPNTQSRGVYLPSGTGWVDFWTGKPLDGGQKVEAEAPIQTMPLFVKAGSILPYGPAIQYATEKPAAPIELRIYPGANGSFTLYEDEGDSYRYERGAYATIDFRWDDAKKRLSIGARKGTYPGMPLQRDFKVVLVTPGHGAGIGSEAQSDRVIRYVGKAIETQL